MRQVAALYVEPSSVYKTLEGVDAYDVHRDARTYSGRNPVIAHPPCRLWSRMRAFSKAPHEEKTLALHAYDCVRQLGGILEHPASSALWSHLGLQHSSRPNPREGYLLRVDQIWWGHPCQKATDLLIIGVSPRDLPPIPYALLNRHQAAPGASKTYTVSTQHSGNRNATPPDLARWLVAVARQVEI